jgi:hypothetical protein
MGTLHSNGVREFGGTEDRWYEGRKPQAVVQVSNHLQIPDVEMK